MPKLNASRLWRSPLRGRWLTSTLGAALLCSLPVVMVTGLLCNDAYNPGLGANVQTQGRTLSVFDFYLFTWPTHPVWLLAATQGVHVTVGLAVIPIVLAKQWSVLPRLFVWPPVRSISHALERLSLLFLVGGIFFELGTGILYIEYWVPFHFDFTAAHYYGAWVFFAAFALHVSLKLTTMRHGLALRRELAPLRTKLADTAPEPRREPDSLVPVDPGPVTISRRTALGVVAGGSALLGLQGIAQDVGGPVRSLAFLLPRGQDLGAGPNDFPVNGTFSSLGLKHEVLTDWRLHLKRRGSDGAAIKELRLTRDSLLKLPQQSYRLPIACKEGWSTTQLWTGVRLRDLAAIVGLEGELLADLTALDGAEATLASNQVAAESALLALSVNGVPLSPDHGYPARVIVPAAIAVNCLKWVQTVSFRRDG